jgi:putative transcriptional regulator
MPRIKNRLKVLLAEKELREGRKISYRVLAEETGLSLDTITAYMNQRVSRYDESTLLALCNYLGCEISDLIFLDTTERPG